MEVLFLLFCLASGALFIPGKSGLNELGECASRVDISRYHKHFLFLSRGFLRTSKTLRELLQQPKKQVSSCCQKLLEVGKLPCQRRGIN